MNSCITCSEEIIPGDERKWGKKFKCSICTKAYNAKSMADRRTKERGSDWVPKSTPRHAMLNCDGKSHKCTGCDSIKVVEDFPLNKETPCGYDPRCKQCRHEARRKRMGAVKENPRAKSPEERTERQRAAARKYADANVQKLKELNRIFKLKRNFGLSTDQYAWLLSVQNAKCFMCKLPESRIDSRTGIPTSLAVDHDHRCCAESNKSCGACIRHLLCSLCNVMVGIAESKPEVAYRFADYVDLRPLSNYPGEGNW